MKKLFYGFIIIVTIATACTKDSIFQTGNIDQISEIQTKNNNKGYITKEGILHFENSDKLLELMNSLEGMSEDEFYEWENNNQFYSLYHAIQDAEDKIFSDSLSFETNLKAYNNLVYLDNDNLIQPYVRARFYQLICNKDGYFYIGKYKHQITNNEVITVDNKLRSIERKNYIENNTVQTRVEEDPRFPVGSSSYKGNKRLVQITMLYIRKMIRDANGNWVGQQVLQLESTAGKKIMGKYKKYKTIHSCDVLAFYVDNVAYQKSDGSYSSYVVRYEALGGAGSVGEEKVWIMTYPLSPRGIWIPEQYIPVKQTDLHILQVRVKTRGTGDSGAVISSRWNTLITLPFSIPQTGAPTILRPLVTENFS